MTAVTIYCAASTQLHDDFHAPAEALGTELGRRGCTLVYGGGSVGLMGEIGRAARTAGSRVVGIITQALLERELADHACDELVVVETMQERKRLLRDRGDVFIMLPGGVGTYEEFFETLVGRHLGEHTKPIGIMNTRGYFDPLLEMLSHGTEHRFICESVVEMLAVHDDPINVLDSVCAMHAAIG